MIDNILLHTDIQDQDMLAAAKEMKINKAAGSVSSENDERKKKSP